MFNLNNIHPSWQSIILNALDCMDQNYLENLQKNSDWLPSANNIFNAFSLPLKNTRYILFGESPYPRKQSANGYAFWDADVDKLWSETGLSKQVNRATSLRNWIKQLLITEGLLTLKDTSQQAIASIDKSALIQTLDELFHNLLNHGFLLLNTSLVLQARPAAQEAKIWLPFMRSILTQLKIYQDEIQLILFGKIAEQIDQMPEAREFQKIRAEHPYNVSFIQNMTMHQFFAPFRLLGAGKK